MVKPRLACDRCHALKEKCIFHGSGPGAACSRCIRLAAHCTTSRRRNEVGRPRKPETAPTKPQAGAEFVWFGSAPAQSSATDQQPSTSDIAATSSVSQPRAGRKLKPKPSRGRATAAAPSPLTTTSASTPTPQPEPTHLPPSDTNPDPDSNLNPTPVHVTTSLFLTTSTPATTSLTTHTPTPASAPRLTPHQSRLVHAYLTNKQGVSRFVLSTSFADAVLSHFCATLVAAPEIMLDITLACASVMVGVEARWTLLSRAGGCCGAGDGDDGGGNGPGGLEEGRRRGGGGPGALGEGVGVGLGRRYGGEEDEGGGVQPAAAAAAAVMRHDGKCYSHGARAVEVLRRMERDAREGRFGTREVVLALTLGLGVMVFESMDSGLWALQICRFTLGMVERAYRPPGGERIGVWVHEAGRAPDVDEGLVPLVFMDVCNCVVRGQMPICRLKMGHDMPDKSLGVCGPLLAVLFDICRVSCELRTAGTRSQGVAATLRAALLAELSDIEEAVLQWDPPSPDAADAFSLDDIRGMRLQAKVFKAATVLIIHRLRYGFGTRDDEAKQLARIILRDIDKICSGTPHPGGQFEDSSPQHDYRLRLPFFVAAIEVEDPTQRLEVLDQLQSVVSEQMYPHAFARLREALPFAWGLRDRRRGTHWSDLLPRSTPPFVL